MTLFTCSLSDKLLEMVTPSTFKDWTRAMSGNGDHLQLTKFWPSCACGRAVCGGVKFFGSALLQPVYSVCLSKRFLKYFVVSLVFIIKSSTKPLAITVVYKIRNVE